MLDVARSVRGARLPAPPTDPAQLVLYATASEGQAQPDRLGDVRYRTSGDALYTTYSLLGELEHASFSFDSDTRLAREPARLAAARTLWMPRGSVLDAAFAQRVVDWVRAGGTLIVTDPDAFTTHARRRAPPRWRAARRPHRRAAGPAPRGQHPGGAAGRSGGRGAGRPAQHPDRLARPAGLRLGAGRRDAWSPASSTARPAAILRRVGAGRVLAFSADPMAPSVLDGPMDLARFVGDLHEWAGGSLGNPAWTYRIPGDPDPGHLPWPDAIEPAAAQAGMYRPPRGACPGHRRRRGIA